MVTTSVVDFESASTILLGCSDYNRAKRIVSMLEQAGYKVIHARTGAEALSYLQGMGHSLSLFCCEHTLDNPDVYELMGITRQSPGYSKLPILILIKSSEVKSMGPYGFLGPKGLEGYVYTLSKNGDLLLENIRKTVRAFLYRHSQ